MVLTGWLERREREALTYLIEENRLLRRQLGGRRLLLTIDGGSRCAPSRGPSGVARDRDDRDGRYAAARHGHLVARKWTYGTTRSSRSGVLAEIRRLVVRMAEENPTWGYTRIQGALKNVGHHVGRSTIARTWRGLVTYYTVFVIDVASRRVQILGATPHPNDVFMRQVSRTLTGADDGALRGHCVLICDRDRKWSVEVRRLLYEADVRVVRTPLRAPNANAHAECFVRSIKEECLDRMMPLGERHFRLSLTEFVNHYHQERNHQGLENAPIAGTLAIVTVGRVHRRSRLGGLLNYYQRAA
jgi:transposase InsO family protein